MSKQKDESIYRNGWNDGFAKGAAAARFQLEAENAELREEYGWISEFQSRMAERIRGDADVHNLVDYVNKLEAENARLRSEFESIGTVAYLYGRSDLKAENAKLRELCERFAEYVSYDRCEGCICKSACSDGEIDECWQLAEIREAAHELGVEP